MLRSRLRFGLVYCGAMLIFALAVLEIGSRFLPLHTYQNPFYLKNSAGYSDLHQLLKDKEEFGLTYFEYFIFSSTPGHTSTINIEDSYGAPRVTPDSVPSAQAGVRIWTFGGSTMANFETADKDTIANTIAKVLNAANLKAHVVNYGVSSFQSSLELVKFASLAARTGKQQRPDMALFYDGFNDAYYAYYFGAGNLQGDISTKLAKLVEGRFGIHGPLRRWAKSSRFAQVVYQSQLLGGNAPTVSDQAGDSSANLTKAVDIYLANVDMQQAMCGALGARCLFVLQPLISSKAGLQAGDLQLLELLDPRMVAFVRAFYDEVRKRTKGRDDFVDGSGILDNNGRDDFYDLGHTSALTSPHIGEWLGKRVLASLGASDSSAGSPAAPVSAPAGQ